MQQQLDDSADTAGAQPDADEQPRVVPDRRSTSGRRFGLGLAAVLLVAAVVRIWCATAIMGDRPVPIDAMTVRTTAQAWVDGHGISQVGQPGQYFPDASHVPVHLTTIALLDRIGLGEPSSQRVALGLLSLVGVAAVALTGRLLDRPAVGLVAASIAALSPIWFQPATNLMAEGVFLVTMPIALLAAVWCRERPTWIRLGLMAAAIGVAGLTRSEALLLFPTIALPLAWLSSDDWKGRLRATGVVVIAFGLVLAPWAVRVRADLGHWAISTNQGGTLLGASCDSSFSGARIGAWEGKCFTAGLRAHPSRTHDQVEVSSALQHDAVEYVKAHKGELPKVAAARVGRLWGVAYVSNTLDYDVAEDRDRGLQEIGYILNWVLIGLTAIGMVLLSREQWARWWLLVPPIAVATVAGAVFWGTPRFRTGAEASLVLFAAFALVEIATRIRHVVSTT